MTIRKLAPFLALVAMLCGCATEYVGVARAPTIPLAPLPIQEPEEGIAWDADGDGKVDGIAFTHKQWAVVLMNTLRDRAWMDGTVNLVTVYNDWVKRTTFKGEEE